MKKWLLPIRLIILFLAFFACWASFSWTDGNPLALGIHIRNWLFILGGECVVFFLLRSFLPIASFRWEHFVITALILFLLFDSLSPWWLFLAAGAIAQTIERILRVPGSPIFNPAAAGAFVLAFFGFFPSWWGTNFAPRFQLFQGDISIAVLFTIVCAGYIAYRYNKLPIVLAALPLFLVMDHILIGNNALYAALEGTFAFFLLVMAIEPKTSPNTKKDQYFYGILLGILVPIGMRLQFPDSYLGALLVVNLYAKKRFFVDFFKRDSTASTPSTP